jgi:hypothetical protein
MFYIDGNYWASWGCWHSSRYMDNLQGYGYLVLLGHRQMNVFMALFYWRLVGFKAELLEWAMQS